MRTWSTFPGLAVCLCQFNYIPKLMGCTMRKAWYRRGGTEAKRSL